jgi:hypothetical protein
LGGSGEEAPDHELMWVPLEKGAEEPAIGSFISVFGRWFIVREVRRAKSRVEVGLDALE